MRAVTNALHHCSTTLNILLLKRWYHIHFEDVFKSPPDKMKCYSFPGRCIALRVTIIQISTSYLLTQMNEFLLKMCMYVCPVCSSVRRWIVPAESTCSSSYLNISVLATGAFGLFSGDFVKLWKTLYKCMQREMNVWLHHTLLWLCSTATRFNFNILSLFTKRSKITGELSCMMHIPHFIRHSFIEIKAALRKNNR